METRIIGVHGFGYDPKSSGNDPWKLYHEWTEMLGRQVEGFAWYSAPMAFGWGLVRAWASGHVHRYRYAYETLAVRAADQLAEKIWRTSGKVQLMCHSLGSRVVIRAVRKMPAEKVERILVLNGAEHADQVRWQFHHPRVLNVAVRSDDVLARLGATFTARAGACIGQAGRGGRAQSNWIDLFLDDAATQKRALDLKGWALEGDQPGQVADHWYSYRHRGNWPLYRAWVAGEIGDVARIAEPT